MRHVKQLLMGAVLFTGCDSKSTIKAEGTATVRHVVSIEFGVCDSIEEAAAKLECVKALLSILEVAVAEKTSKPTNIVGDN